MPARRASEPSAVAARRAHEEMPQFPVFGHGLMVTNYGAPRQSLRRRVSNEAPMRTQRRMPRAPARAKHLIRLLRCARSAARLAPRAREAAQLHARNKNER